MISWLFVNVTRPGHVHDPPWTAHVMPGWIFCTMAPLMVGSASCGKVTFRSAG